MTTPGSTYRVQLRSEFDFDDAAGIAEYLTALGVTHLYCSPYLQAAPGSTHGYDVVDPHVLSADLGGTAGHAGLVGALRDAGLGQVLDIVPNHMAVDRTNRWWWDVLENGPSSRFARFFDIDWESGDERRAFRVLVPVLGDHYGRVLEAGELSLGRNAGRVTVRYHEHELPLSPRTLDDVLAPAARRAGSPDLAELADRFAALPHARSRDDRSIDERHARKVELIERLARLCEEQPDVAAAVDVELAELGHDHDRLDTLLERQNYHLAHWRTASEELDYRRFFNIDSLIGVRVEDPEVFTATHELILALVRDGTVEGLRIDHVDGLRDPGGYLGQLAEASGGCWTVVEKILEPGEPLPDSWPVAGTSGYDFLIRVNNVFVDPDGESAMNDAYTEFTGESADYPEVVHVAKHRIMAEELAAEVDRMTGLLASVCNRHRRHHDHTRRDLREAICELVAAFPVYRTYVTETATAEATDREHVEHAVRAAGARRPDLDPELLEFLGRLACGDVEGGVEREFAIRLQQLTAPVMAKGVEDTAFYRYHRLISLNEVGGDPGVFGRPVPDFHRDTAAAAERWPASMLTLSTHDTKRSADVRARLNVLSEIPQAWGATSLRWADHNARHRRDGWPDRNTEYLLYQTIVGAWPIDPDRLVAFMAKATREAKVHTSWADPVREYDDAVEGFVRAVLADAGFVDDLEAFLAEHRIVERGRQSSLAQMALLLTCPGVPDVYQGTELWDLSLVDPDNRRPVDYELRRRLLGDVPALPGPLGEDEVGVEKLRLVRQLLAHRRANEGSYVGAPYEPLEAPDDVVAFSRGDLVTVVPCRTAAPSAGTVDLPAGTWVDVVTGARLDGGGHDLRSVLGWYPVAVLARERT